MLSSQQEVVLFSTLLEEVIGFLGRVIIISKDNNQMIYFSPILVLGSSLQVLDL